MADTANNRQFSVMVDSGGVLSYPQNFITANSLASFGSDVVGTFKQIKLGNENTGASTIILNSTEDENLGYNTDLIISNKNLSGYTNRIILNFSENNNDPTVGPGLKMEYNTVLGTADIRLNTTSSTHDSGSIYLNSFDTSITCNSQFTVSANYGVSLNSSEGGFSMNMPEGNTLIKTGGLTSILSQKESGAVEIGVGHSYFDMPAPGTLSNNIIIDKDKIAVSAPLVELPANTTIGGATPAIFGSEVAGTLGSLTVGLVTCNGTSSGIRITKSTRPIIIRGGSGSAAAIDIRHDGPAIMINGTSITNMFAAKSDVVDLTNEQTITGNKAFTGNVTIGGDEPAILSVPQYLRVFDTVTKKWTNTYKYTYLAQDANGNATLVISDTAPLVSNINSFILQDFMPLPEPGIQVLQDNGRYNSELRFLITSPDNVDVTNNIFFIELEPINGTTWTDGNSNSIRTYVNNVTKTEEGARFISYDWRSSITYDAGNSSVTFYDSSDFGNRLTATISDISTSKTLINLKYGYMYNGIKPNYFITIPITWTPVD